MNKIIIDGKEIEISDNDNVQFNNGILYINGKRYTTDITTTDMPVDPADIIINVHAPINLTNVQPKLKTKSKTKKKKN